MVDYHWYFVSGAGIDCGQYLAEEAPGGDVSPLARLVRIKLIPRGTLLMFHNIATGLREDHRGIGQHGRMPVQSECSMST